MKWNWGTGIFFSFIGFCGLMVFMVIRSFQQDFHLVSQQYYQEELLYQNRIEEMTNNLHLKEKVEIKESLETLSVHFPQQEKVSGQIHFYKPDNARLDRHFEISGNFLEIKKNRLSKGRYIAKISWKTDVDRFYQEKQIIVN